MGYFYLVQLFYKKNKGLNLSGPETILYKNNFSAFKVIGDSILLHILGQI
jgi:hypothetical protein